MEPDVSIKTSRQIRVAISVAHLREYTSLIACHSRVDLASVASYTKQHQKFPFSHQPWDSGSLSHRLVRLPLGRLPALLQDPRRRRLLPSIASASAPFSTL
ncbi:Trafficking protein particle complex ii-specific subunit 120-like protein [Rhynchospora pubera]|uniref:Trafficking protein particle complex ii-specific subunit 120-like protein n=1 Tax=Rhynchospora pubera TaxID=906938 RepID=A0AAV8CNV0_9POAL|nr:Trafficking protein particle complex ii-specific subunit 120-like protein [Rhynchospora pubera]KAJ4801614.1 Trafficking protein particle complex ii-specific subunit 120-like protein [Rhynchospora pubera]